jgi:D-serine deaminase-like pyridoxal phosphate-dependent protein
VDWPHDPDFHLTCWVDSVRGVRLMTDELNAAGAHRPVDVCVELGAAGTRTGCRDDGDADAVAAAALASPRPFLSLAPAAEDTVRVGDWIEFGVSHPCTVFDKWQLIPVLDADDWVLDLVRTFF